MKRKKKKLSVFSVLNYGFFVILGVIMLYPFWYVVMYSFSDPSKTSLSSLYLIPNGFSLETYRYAFKKEILLTGFLNSVFLAVVGDVYKRQVYGDFPRYHQSGSGSQQAQVSLRFRSLRYPLRR